jgi:hypothetical protein
MLPLAYRESPIVADAFQNASGVANAIDDAAVELYKSTAHEDAFVAGLVPLKIAQTADKSQLPASRDNDAITAVEFTPDAVAALVAVDFTSPTILLGIAVPSPAC